MNEHEEIKDLEPLEEIPEEIPEESQENSELTQKQEIFVYEYLQDFNATQAAIRAGYSEHSASDIGKENLQKPKILALLQNLLSERKNELIASRTELEIFLTAMMRGTIKSQIAVQEGKGKGITETVLIEKFPDGRERLKAAEQLAKLQAREKDSVNDNIPIIICDDVPET